MSLEAELGVGVEGVADLARGDVLALDVELDAVNGTDDAVGQIQGELGGGVLAEVVVVLELVQVAGWADDVVAGGVALDDGTRATLEGALDQGLSGAVVHVGEGDAGERAWGRVWVDESCVVADAEVHPFEVGGNALRSAEDVGVHGALALNLAAHLLVELLEGSL